jgi:hypothetical protein
MDILPIVNKVFEIYKTVFSIDEKLRKFDRYRIGIKLEESILTLLKTLIMAKNAPKPMKSAYLISASAELETAMLMLRIYLENNLVNNTRIFQTQAMLEEAGRMLGGWIKSLQNSPRT